MVMLLCVGTMVCTPSMCIVEAEADLGIYWSVLYISAT
jgi:hypothetical protein